MKKILYISCVSLACGGAERILSILSYTFAEAYDDVIIFTWRDLDVFYIFDKRVRIISIERESRSKNPIKKMFWFRCYVQKHKPGLIISFLAKSSIQTLLSVVGLGVRVVVAERNDPRHLRGGKLMIMIRDLLYNMATGILEQTENNKAYFKGTKYKRTEVIYNPVLMKPAYVGSALNQNKEKKIVSVGRLVPQKNHKMLIEVFAKIHKSYPDYVLYIYGEGVCRNFLERLIENLNLKNYIFLPGNETQILDVIKNATLFVLPSDFEGMPNALIEAMCLGLPCISTKVSGATELVKNGINGLLINIGDSEMLYQAIYKLITNNEYAKKIGEEAVNIYPILAIENISKKWITFIDKFYK